MQSPRFNGRSGIKWMLLAMACGTVLFSASAVVQPPAVQPPPVPAPTLADLAMARYQIASKGFDMSISGHQPNDAPGPDVLDWMRRRVKARLEIVEPKNDRIIFVKEYVELLRKEEEFEERMVKSRLHGIQNLLRAQYDRLEGEALLKQIEAK